jgi:hypothetical protein
LSDEELINLTEQLSKYFRKNAKPAIKLEDESEFHERSRYRLVANDKIPEEWDELQASLPPPLFLMKTA